MPETIETSAPSPAPTGASRLEFSVATVVIFSVLAAIALATIGSLTDICLGDENPHVRHVRQYSRTMQRDAYDGSFSMDNRVRLPLYWTPLWHFGLAWLWKLFGTQSQVLAQAYQAAFYLLLLLCTYFAVRRIWDVSAASWAWLLVATMPMVCVYSVLLFQDVPGVAVSALAIFLLWRRNFFACGLAMAAAYFVKLNMLTFAPWAVAAAAWLSHGNLKRRVLAAAMVALPVGAIFAYDTAWRLTVYEGRLVGPNTDIRRYAASSPDFSSDQREAIAKAYRTKPARYFYWQPYNLYEFSSIVSNVGVAVLVGLAAALVLSWDRESLWLWACAALAVAGFIMFFGRYGSPQVRYLLPALLPVMFLGARALSRWRMRAWLKAAIIAACVAQAAAACGFIAFKRNICDDDRRAYAWLRKNVQPGNRIFSPEQIITNQTGREYVWSPLTPSYFMTMEDDASRLLRLGAFRVSHVAVPLRRTYDRAVEGDHAGGFARDFLEHMYRSKIFEKVYSNEGFVVFRVVYPPATE